MLRAAISTFLGVLGFAILVHAPRRSWIPASLLGMASYLLEWALCQAGLPEPAGIFLGTLAGTFAGLWCAVRMKMIGTTFLMMTIVSFVPGLGLYRCMWELGEGATGAGAKQGVAAMIIIAMIVLGQAFGSFLFRAFHRNHHQ